jgi:Integrase zinc binding domain
MDVSTSITDHKNNTFINLQTQCVLCWQLFLEDYVVKFRYIKGESNSLADALSCLPFDERQNPPDWHDHPSNQYDATVHNKNFKSFSSLANNADLIDLFVHLPLSENVPFVLDYHSIAQAQTGDTHLQQLCNCTPGKFQHQLLAPNTSRWCYTVDPNQQWKIYLPDALLEHAIQWYHMALSHIGTRCLMDTMSATFYNPKLRSSVEAVIKPCSHVKNTRMSSMDMVKLLPERQGYPPGVKLPWT